MNSTNETLLFDRFLIMYDLCVFTCIIFIFVLRCTHVRMSYVLNAYLLTYLLTGPVNQSNNQLINQSINQSINLLGQIKIHKINSNDNNCDSAKWTKRLDEHLQMATVKPTRKVRLHVQRDAYTQ